MRLAQIISDYIRRSILITQGDLVVRGASQPERLASGALFTYLRGKGAGVIPAYEAEPTIPAMRATLSVSQSIPTGAWTIVQFDGTDYDTTNYFDGVNNRWICGVAGKYLIIVNIVLGAIPDGTLVGVAGQLNGRTSSPFEYMTVGGLVSSSVQSTDVLALSVNDFIKVLGFQNSGVNKSVLGRLAYGTWFTVHRLS